MLRHIVRFITASVVALVLGGPAGAQCFGSLFGLVEIFSNADGSVQFMVLDSAIGDGVSGRLAGQTLVASDGSAQHSYTFPADMVDTVWPVLVGTQGFANLHLVNPDFVVPDGFVFVRNGSVRLDGSVWCGGPVNYDAIPIDGVNAYWPDASIASGVIAFWRSARSAGQFLGDLT
jgi:hypothetical protein